MSTSAIPRDERIDLRVSSELKSILIRAASLAGMSVSSFLVSSAAERARALLTEHEAITLSARDWEAFLTALDQEGSPAPRLQEAAQRYLERQQGHEI